MPRQLAAALLSLSLAACTSIGPGTVPHDRIDYASAIGNSWKEQTLLNIVKLRYADMPIFLEVAQVIAGYQLQSAIGGSFTAGNFTAGIVGPFTAVGSANAAGTYTDRPTVIYSPLTGVDFLKRLMTPIPPSSVLFMLQSGYFADRIMPIMLDSINGLNNESNRLRRPADPKFTRLVELMREGQLAGAIQIRIERSKAGAESSVLIFGPSKDPALAARGRELKSLLGIKPDLRELKVNYGGYSGKDNEIDMMTRSMLQIMLEFAAIVQVPEADVDQGKAVPGLVDTQVQEAPSGPPMRVLVTDTPPKDAHVAVQYDKRWFWIAKTDIQSKYTFAVIMLLFSIADTGVKGAAPVVTIPANQ
jgi:predicted small lipoprotein YifL